MDDKKYNSELATKFTPTATIKTSSPFINKTEDTGNTVKFKCTGVTQK